MDLRHQDESRPRPLRADRLALRVGSLRHEDPGSFDQGAAPRRPFRRNVARRCGAPRGPWKQFFFFFFGENHGFFTTFTRKQLRFNQEKGMCFLPGTSQALLRKNSGWNLKNWGKTPWQTDVLEYHAQELSQDGWWKLRSMT